MSTARTDFTAVALGSDKVLVAGGWDGSAALSSAELYDSDSRMFGHTGPLKHARYGHTATALDDTAMMILIAGGSVDSNTVLASAEIYDVAGQAFVQTGSMKKARANHTATLLPNSHKVLIAGGGEPTDIGEVGWAQLTSAELYDIATGKFALTGSLKQAREAHTATLVGSDQVLIVGGHDWDPHGAMDPRSYLSSAELYTLSTAKFSPAGSLKQGRDDHVAVPLTAKRVLVAGGGTEAICSGSPCTPALKSAEIWQL
jgi:hypothetical protein